MNQVLVALAILAASVVSLLLVHQNEKEELNPKFELNCIKRGGHVIRDGVEFLSSPAERHTPRIQSICVNKDSKII